MSYTTLAQSAADWALSKVGCAFSQAQRTQENIFDCSSRVARAYSAQGKRWKYGGSVPTSNKEIYDDDFELLWPATYAQIGIAAPIILQTLRHCQGLGLGGEWGGAVLRTYEYASKRERAFYASIPQMGLATGLCLSSGVVALLSWGLTNEQFMAWGWRCAFLLSVVLVGVAL